MCVGRRASGGGGPALGNTGAVALVNALAQHCPQLQVLELGCNDITPSGAKRMAPAIAAMRQLRKLNLSENELGDKGIWDVGAALMQCPCVPLPFTCSVALVVPNRNLCRGSTEASLRSSPHQSALRAPVLRGCLGDGCAHAPSRGSLEQAMSAALFGLVGRPLVRGFGPRLSARIGIRLSTHGARLARLTQAAGGGGPEAVLRPGGGRCGAGAGAGGEAHHEAAVP